MQHACLMLYGTISSFQPAKGLLLSDTLMEKLCTLLDPREAVPGNSHMSVLFSIIVF